MLVYEFYLWDREGKADLIGILPERRKNDLRITQASVMRWGMMVAGDHVDVKDLFFIQSEL
jgi:hypothetical protein